MILFGGGGIQILSLNLSLLENQSTYLFIYFEKLFEYAYFNNIVRLANNIASEPKHVLNSDYDHHISDTGSHNLVRLE